MARWRLTGKHYLNVPGTEWEYKELDQTTGKQGRKVFPVPAYLDPDDPSDCNYPGEIIVTNKESREYPRDIVFYGEPTPDMEPLDDSAVAITEATRHKWVHPIESLAGNYSQSILADFQKQLAEVASAKPASPIAASQVSKADFDALQAQVAALMVRNAELEAEPKASRRA